MNDCRMVDFGARRFFFLGEREWKWRIEVNIANGMRDKRQDGGKSSGMSLGIGIWR